jgi:hypothetical protein
MRYPGGTQTIIGMPDGRLIEVALRQRLMPPTRRTRMIMAPINNIAMPPIKIAFQPPAYRKAQAERDER